MADWTEEQSNKTTALYNQLTEEYKKIANKKLFSGPQLPYEQAKGILESLLEEQKSKSGLESKVKAAHDNAKHKSGNIAKADSITVLLGIVTAIGAGVAGYPVIAVAAAAVTLTSLYQQYQKSYQHKSV